MTEAIAARLGQAGAPGFKPKVAVILGSGLGGFADEVKAVATIPYSELPGFPETTVGSHAGRLVLGHVGPTPVAVLQGRAHYYERGKADEMRGAIRAVAELGCETLLQTNAAGSLRLDMPPGSVMAISDHINFAGINPLFVGPDAPRRVGCNDHSRRRFVQALEQGDRRAQPMIDLYRALYHVERTATERNLDATGRHALRQAIAVTGPTVR